MNMAALDLTTFALGAVAGLVPGLVAAFVRAFMARRRVAGLKPRWNEIRPAPVLHETQAGAVPVGAREQVDVEATPSRAEPESMAVLAPRGVRPRAELRDTAMLSAAEQAAALLAVLQGPGGVPGRETTSSEIEGAFTDLCLEQGWAPRPWISVAAELRKALGGAKTYGYRDGHRVRVWRIPAAPVQTPPMATAIRRAA